jgi:hypothetical protein
MQAKDILCNINLRVTACYPHDCPELIHKFHMFIPKPLKYMDSVSVEKPDLVHNHVKTCTWTSSFLRFLKKNPDGNISNEKEKRMRPF